MKRRPMTNVEKVEHIMTFSNYGALAQLFVIDALHKWSDIVSKASPGDVGNGFVSGEAWIAVAKEIRDKLKSEMTIDDAECEDDW